MEYLLLVYTDLTLLEALPADEFATMMRSCLVRADEQRDDGVLVDARQLEAPATARAVRVRAGRTTVLDGPFAETKEVLAGFNLVRADSLEHAVAMAEALPWARTGCIEVRPVRDMNAVRLQVGAPLPDAG